MQPIINPFFIYLLNVCDNLRILLFMFVVIFTVGFGTLAFVKTMLEEDLGLGIKAGFIAGICFLVLFAFVPSKKTLITMYSVKYTTIENAKLGKEVVKDL